jgi:exodeoxyribonuclease V gamma subunit
MLRLIQSNDLNTLANRYAETAFAEVRDVLQADVVIIQSVGTGQWLKLKTAEILGISANMNCQLPAQFIWQLYQSELQLAHQTPIEANTLLFRLMELLPRFDHPVIQHYLALGQQQDLRCYQLASRISQVFERYLLYRPDWITAFETGNNPLAQIRHGDWQQRLWQRLIEADPLLRTRHRAYLHQRLLNHLDTQGLSKHSPNRISLFGLPSLAPMHLETFRSLSEHCQVDLYFMNPSEAYWGDLVTERYALSQGLTSPDLGNPELDDLYFLGNPLLASFGRQGQEFHELLTASHNLVSEEVFLPRHRGNRLSVLQDDIICAYAADESPSAELPELTQDASLEFHSCHSRLREMEVLLDRIYWAMRRRQLDPSDVLVMAPDIQTYVPVIQAVFTHELPFGIADQNQQQNSEILRSFIALLSLTTSRLTASELSQYLDIAAIARRFSLDQEASDRIKQWIQALGIRWEQDGEAKHDRWNLPAEHSSTWQFGIDKLLMGLMTDADTVFKDILPYPIGLEDLDTLESFLALSTAIVETRDTLDTAKTPGAWSEALNIVVKRFFEASGQEHLALDQLFSLIETFASQSEEAGLTRAVDIDFVQSWFSDQLNRPNPAMRFISGGITFSTLTPMRSIPFKMICLIGMNDGEFPRQEPKHPFNLMTELPQRLGDRSQRDDDRYLFLEALLSARELLFISYCGRGIRDNEVKPPSVLVSEVLDYCQATTGELPIFDHPLQPFSKRYFTEPRFHSFQTQWRPPISHHKLWQSPLGQVQAALPPPESCATLELSRFYGHTARYFYEGRLGITFDQVANPLEDAEPFALDPLTRYQVVDDAIKAVASGMEHNDWLKRINSMGLAPKSINWQRQIATIYDDAQTLFTAIAPYYQHDRSRRSRQIKLDHFALQTSFSQLSDHHNLIFRAGNLTPKHLVKPWLDHLLLAARGESIETLGFGLHQSQQVTGKFSPLPQQEAKALLQRYIDGYLSGTSTLLVLPFDTAVELLTLQEKMSDILDLGHALDQKWSNPERWREAMDPYWQRLIPAPSQIIETLHKEAQHLIQPILEHWEAR